MEKTYYSLGDKETLGQKVAKKKQSTVKRIETTPDFSASDVKSDEISAKDITSLVGGSQSLSVEICIGLNKKVPYTLIPLTNRVFSLLPPPPSPLSPPLSFHLDRSGGRLVALDGIDLSKRSLRL